jgi:hypothetical protein
VNEKATAALHSTEYCEVDFSVKVEVLETKDTWSKIRVVDPEWLMDSHVGWIPTKYLLSKEEEAKNELGTLNIDDYEILKIEDKSSFENYHVLLKVKNFDKQYVHYFTKQFRNEHCTNNCNVYVYDSKSIMSLIGVYPLEKEDYIRMADHFIARSDYSSPEGRDWYPFQDYKYKEYGGNNWKREPVK